MSIREALSNSKFLATVNEYDNGAMVQLSIVFGHVYDVACR